MVARAAVLAFPVAALAAALPKPTDFDALIVGGEPAVAGDFPFIVSLSEGGSHFCGGTLINANTVVTAAHCSTGQDPAAAAVRAGSLQWAAGGTQVGVSSIVIHPAYSSSTLDNDIAIWKLSESIAEGSGIAYAGLPAAGSDPAGGSATTVAGWGTTSQGSGSIPNDLLKVTVPVVDRETCNQQYGGEITAAMFCAGLEEGGKDACQGDSGGPIVDASNTLVGVVSWGQGCAQAGFAGVYSNVGALLDFVSSNA